jgi:hypothetical protein
MGLLRMNCGFITVRRDFSRGVWWVIKIGVVARGNFLTLPRKPAVARTEELRRAQQRVVSGRTVRRGQLLSSQRVNVLFPRCNM